MDLQEIKQTIGQIKSDLEATVDEAVVQLKTIKPEDYDDPTYDEWADAAHEVARMALFASKLDWYSSEINCQAYYMYENLF